MPFSRHFPRIVGRQVGNIPKTVAFFLFAFSHFETDWKRHTTPRKWLPLSRYISNEEMEIFARAFSLPWPFTHAFCIFAFATWPSGHLDVIQRHPAVPEIMPRRGTWLGGSISENGKCSDTIFFFAGWKF